MKETKYTVKYTTSFKKDYKRAIKRGLKIELLEQVVALLFRFLFCLLRYWFLRFHGRWSCFYPFCHFILSVQAEHALFRILLLRLPSQADGELAVACHEEGLSFGQTGTSTVQVGKQPVVRRNGWVFTKKEISQLADQIHRRILFLVKIRHQEGEVKFFSVNNGR